MPRRGALLFVEDIYESCNKILAYVNGYNYGKFKIDLKTVDAVTRNLEIIGEAAKALPPDFKKKYPKIPWRDISAMRNKVAHEYFGVDDKILWTTTQEDIPILKNQISEIKKTLKGQTLF